MKLLGVSGDFTAEDITGAFGHRDLPGGDSG
jgi:hypothetical protein